MILSADFFDEMYTASSVLTTTISLKSLATTSCLCALLITDILLQSFLIILSGLSSLWCISISHTLSISFHKMSASTTLRLSQCSRTSVSMLPVTMSFITFSEKRIALLIAGTFLLAVRQAVYNSGHFFLVILTISPALNTSIPLFHRYPSSYE